MRKKFAHVDYALMTSSSNIVTQKRFAIKNELFCEKASRLFLQKFIYVRNRLYRFKMLALTSEFILGLLIGIILGYSLYQRPAAYYKSKN